MMMILSNSLRDKPPQCLSPQDFCKLQLFFFIVVRFVAFIFRPFWSCRGLMLVPLALFWWLLELRGLWVPLGDFW